MLMKVQINIFDSIKGALKNGSRVEVRGFGCFEVRHYDRYKGRNPKTGAVIEVPKSSFRFLK